VFSVGFIVVTGACQCLAHETVGCGRSVRLGWQLESCQTDADWFLPYSDV